MIPNNIKVGGKYISDTGLYIWEVTAIVGDLISWKYLNQTDNTERTIHINSLDAPDKWITFKSKKNYPKGDV